MRGFPTGVAVVTGRDSTGRAVGMTYSALCSLSLSPPLLIICLNSGGCTLAAARQNGAFALNLLHSGGEDVARLFSSREPDRFEQVPWEPSPYWSLPLLGRSAHSFAECRIHCCVTFGDRTVVIGEVVWASLRSTNAKTPLLHGFSQFSRWVERTSAFCARASGVEHDAPSGSAGYAKGT
jgi:flavin reductase (DIM6/NTAB) family NADH-FMN oxidoreductase RutF